MGRPRDYNAQIFGYYGNTTSDGVIIILPAKDESQGKEYQERGAIKLDSDIVELMRKYIFHKQNLEKKLTK